MKTMTAQQFFGSDRSLELVTIPEIKRNNEHLEGPSRLSAIRFEIMELLLWIVEQETSAVQVTGVAEYAELLRMQ